MPLLEQIGNTMVNPYWTQAMPGSGQMPGQEPLRQQPEPGGLQVPMGMSAPPAKKGGGLGDVLRTILGGALDGVAVHYGFEPGAAKQAGMLRELMLRQQEEERQRRTRMEDAIALREYDAAHRPPSEDSFTRALAAAEIAPGTPEYVAKARKRADMLTNPVQLVPDGMGGMMPVRPYGGGEDDVPDYLPPEVVNQITGGGGGNATGGFPR